MAENVTARLGKTGKICQGRRGVGRVGKKSNSKKNVEATVVFIKEAGAGMVQELSGCDKEMQVVQCRCNFLNKTRRRP